MAFKQPPLTPIPSDVQKDNPQLYQYLKRLEGVVLGIVGGVNDAKSTTTVVETNTISSLSGKADKVSGATAGNLAALDAQGNLTDSGADTSDFAAAAKGVTNGDSHDHAGGDGAQITHTSLSAIGTNTHATIDTHLASTANPHAVTKSQVGLGNCDNTADANKPVSTAQQTALDGKVSHSLATAANDVLVASGVGNFVKKTLAELKTILGLGTAAYTASTDYAVAAKGVTNGDSHDHAGGDGAQIAYSSLSGTPAIPAAGSVEPGAVSSSTSGAAGSSTTFARSDHSHDLGAHAHADAASGGTIAHSALTGLTTGDPHTQYILADGTRAFSGIPSCAVAPTTGNHLVNKTYADSLATGGLTGYVKADCSVPFTGGHIPASGAYTGFKFTETGAATDAGKWIYQVDNNQASLLAVNDAETVFNSVWTADRSDANPTYFTVTPPIVASGGINTEIINSQDVSFGIATLNESSLVVQNPANATVTPTANKIPIADSNGSLRAWFVTDDYFEADIYGGLMPSDTPSISEGWELDSNGAIQPKEVS